VERDPSLLKMSSAWVSYEGEDELGKIFRGWSKEGASKRKVESDVVSALVSESYSAAGGLTFSEG